MLNTTAYILAKKYIDTQIRENGGIEGKSAYDIACDFGYEGTEQEWLQWLSPQIGQNGNWIIQGVDSGIPASLSLSGYYNEKNFTALTTKEILDICKK